MLTYFLFVFYFVSGTLLLHVFLRWKKFPFTIYHTAAIVSFKLFLGGLYGYIFLNRYGGDDTWRYFAESKELSEALLHHPARFFQEIMPANSLEATGYSPVRAVAYYMVHFEAWFMPRLLSVFNFFTGKNYYLDLIWFDFLTIGGPLLLYRMLYRRFPENRGMYFLLVFFVPTITFWVSGIRAEALLFCFISWLIGRVIRCAAKPGFWNAVRIAAGLFCVALFRPPLLPVLILALTGLYYSLRSATSTVRPFLVVWTLAAGLFLAGFLLPDAFSPSAYIIKSQRAFFPLKANTRYGLDTLHNNPVSFARVFPQALANSSLRPYPWEGKGLLQSLSAAESLLLVIAVIYYLLSRFPDKRDPLLWFFLFYGLTQLPAIGFVVPFPGAIVRYRCIPLLFLLLFLFCGNRPVHQILNRLVPGQIT